MHALITVILTWLPWIYYRWPHLGKKKIPQRREKEREMEKRGKKNDRRGMITTCKQCDSGGRANERARTGIESKRARAVFQNIHSHTGQWTFGYILSGVREGGSSLNAWDLRKEFNRAWEWQCHGSRQRTLLKRRHNRRACLETLSLLHSLSFFCFYDCFWRTGRLFSQELLQTNE